MMRARLTYVPLEVADQFEDFIIKRDEQILDAVKARTKDYSTLSLLKLLYQLRGNPMTFSELYSKSKIRMKKSFLNYLHLCVDYNFVQKEAVPVSVVMLGALSIGMIIGYGAALLLILAGKSEIRALKNKNRFLSDELNELRNASIDEDIYDEDSGDSQD